MTVVTSPFHSLTSGRGSECKRLLTTGGAGLHLKSEPEQLREHTIAVGVDRVLDSWFPLFRLLVVRSRGNVVR